MCLYILLYIILFIHVSPCWCLSFFLLSHLVPVCRYRGFNSSLTGSSLTSCRTVLTCNIWSLAEPIRFFSFLDQDSSPPHPAGLFYNILYSSLGSSHFFFQDLIFNVNCFGEFHAWTLYWDNFHPSFCPSNSSCASHSLSISGLLCLLSIIITYICIDVHYIFTFSIYYTIYLLYNIW